MPPTIFTGHALSGAPRHRDIIASAAKGQNGVAVMERELRGQEWVDKNPHDETNYVLGRTLLIKCDGEAVEATTGDSVLVPADSRRAYWAPEHARLPAICSSNAPGADSWIKGLRTRSASPNGQNHPLEES